MLPDLLNDVVVGSSTVMPHLATQENHYRFYVIELLVTTPDAISILNAINLSDVSAHGTV
jgi:hypothetical protein